MVERFINRPPHGQRVDLFNIIDILAIDDSSTIGVQSCGQDFAAHKKKILECEYTVPWLQNIDRGLMLIGWRKLKLKRGGKAMRWRPRIAHFRLHFDEIVCH
jgi:hypothetical protein